jgi:hypothetical protein
MKQCNTSAKVIAIGSDFAIQSTSAEIGGLIVDKSAENRPKKNQVLRQPISSPLLIFEILLKRRHMILGSTKG